MQRNFGCNLNYNKNQAGKCGVEWDLGVQSHPLAPSGGSSRNSLKDAYSYQLSSADSAYTELVEVSDCSRSPAQDDLLHATSIAPPGLRKPARPKARTAAFSASAQARRKAIRAMRLIAIAQHLAEVEASKAALSQPVQSSRHCQPGQKKHSNGQQPRHVTNHGGSALRQSAAASRMSMQRQQAGSAEQSGSGGRPVSHLKALVGVRVSVLRDAGEDLQSFCKGQVTQIDDKGLCGINYDNGAQEWLQLEQRNFRLLGPRAPSAGLTPVTQAAMLSTSAVNRADSRATPRPPQCLVPPAQSAIGGRVSVFFSGDGNQHSGWVLAHNRQKGRHHVLYDDGEDEWVSLSADACSWENAPNRYPQHGGLPPNTEPPAGLAAVGYNVAVYWKEDAVFNPARVTAFEHISGTHVVEYKGGSCESLCLREEIVKWLHQPQVPTYLPLRFLIAEKGKASTVQLLSDAALHTWLPHARSLLSPGPGTNRTTMAMASHRVSAFGDTEKHVGCDSPALLTPLICPSVPEKRVGCDSPALLTPLIRPSFGVYNAWELPVMTRQSQEAFNSLQQPSSDGCSDMQCDPQTDVPSQVAALLHTGPSPHQALLAQANEPNESYSSDRIFQGLQRRVSMPLPHSSPSGDDLCRTMVPCGGLVPRSLSDPGPHLLAEDAATTTPARTGSPFVSAPWSGFFDCAPQEDSLQGPASSLYCDLNSVLNFSSDNWAPASSAMAAGQADTDSHLDDLLQTFVAGAT